jgi:hypothetical protein
MDHQDSEHSSEIKTDLSSNQAEKSAKTIHQQNLEKDYRNKVSRRLAYSLAAISMVVLLIVVLVLPVVIQETDEPIQQIEDSQSQTDQLTIDREILAQKPIAQAMFSELLIKIDEIKLSGVQFWGGEQWEMVLRLQQEGDTNYQTAQYHLAANNYRDAMQHLVGLEMSIPALLEESLDTGKEAILSGNKELAINNYETALAIDGINQEAKKGLDRALKLDRVLELTQSGNDFESKRQWKEAMQAFEEALTIDQEWQQAQSGFDRSKEQFETEEFQRLLSSGYQAIRESRFESARSFFNQAADIKRESPEVQQAFEELDTQERIFNIKSMKYKALTAEVNEQWENARTLYKSILNLDPNIGEIKESLARVNQRIELSNNLTYFISNKDKLSDDKFFTQAETILTQAQNVLNPGSILKEQINNMAQILKIAAIPIEVTIFSDNATEISIFKIGNLGVFERSVILLRPGDYRAAGKRKGYRDVQQDFKVSANKKDQSIRVECKERI